MIEVRPAEIIVPALFLKKLFDKREINTQVLALQHLDSFRVQEQGTHLPVMRQRYCPIDVSYVLWRGVQPDKPPEPGIGFTTWTLVGLLMRKFACSTRGRNARERRKEQ